MNQLIEFMRRLFTKLSPDNIAGLHCLNGLSHTNSPAASIHLVFAYKMMRTENTRHNLLGLLKPPKSLVHHQFMLPNQGYSASSLVS